MDIEVEVANTNHSAWRWKNTKRKTDKDDALKLAQLSAMNQLPTVHVPARSTRQWRALIEYRQKLVQRQTASKNQIRAILERESMSLPTGTRGFTQKALDALDDETELLKQVETNELWRGMLHVETTYLEHVRGLIKEVERKLNAIAKQDENVRRLQTIPGVGARLSEAVVAVLDDARRFKTAKQVGAYIGLVPKQYQSGQMNRHARITGTGNRTLRTLLVEVAWIGLRFNPWMRQVYERVRAGSGARKKVAIVAVARRLLIRCWAMLRDQTAWRDPTPVGAGTP